MTTRGSTVAGLCFIVLGLMLTVDGYQATPYSWLRLGLGVAFIIVGIIRIALPRKTSTPPA
jgi:hypothetical protein